MSRRIIYSKKRSYDKKNYEKKRFDLKLMTDDNSSLKRPCGVGFAGVRKAKWGHQCSIHGSKALCLILERWVWWMFLKSALVLLKFFYT